jgi:hypothetical protein
MNNRAATLLLATLFLFATFCAGAKIKATDIEGQWIGGYKLGDKWVYMNAHFENNNMGMMKATIGFPFENETELTQIPVNLNHTNMEFILINGSGTLYFDGECGEVTISGCVKHAGKKGEFYLFRVPRTHS